MFSENEGYKTEVRRQSQNEERYFSTEPVVKWRSSLPKDIVNSTWSQDAVTQIHKTDIHWGTRHRLLWLRKEENLSGNIPAFALYTLP